MCQTYKAYEWLRRALISQERDEFTAFGEGKRERKKSSILLKERIFFSPLLIDYGKQNLK